MVMMAAPLAVGVRASREDLLAQGIAGGPVVRLAASGRRVDQAWLEEKLVRPGAQDNGPCPAEPNAQPVAQTPSQPQAASITQQMTLVCGRYEGVDQRFINNYVTEELSLGDFVISGGEIAALAVLDG